ncbi:MAG: hypothetical protein P1U85_15835 [Verrucomicrobiales bacterium]|nr:hypothetical protein [Verrucomicrobiales bacterium]
MRYRRPFLHSSLILGLALSGVSGISQEKEEEGNSLGDLFKKVKEIKVPESVTGLPDQITELKESYLETAKTVEDLRHEVEMLRQEVYDLKKKNEELSKAVGANVEAEGVSNLLKPVEVSSTQLVERFVEDRTTAEERYRDRYLKVVGIIDRFETGPQAIYVYLRAEGQDAMVKAQVQTGTDMHVEALTAQGRLISRNDRRTLLSVGQPVAIVGTCRGFSLNVEIINGRIDGLSEKKTATAPAKN